MITTSDEFNEKWKQYLEPGHYGMTIEHPKVLEYMDKEFEKETKLHSEFTFAQIKLKFHTARVYTNSQQNDIWEMAIDDLIKENSNES